MTETRFAVRVPHTMRAWYVLMDFPDGTTELMVIFGGGAPHTLDTTLTLEDIRTWGLQDYDRIKVQVTERKVEDGGDDEMETSSKKHKVEKIMTDIVRKINTRLERGETITEIVGAYYNYNNLVDLLCGIYDLTFEERKEVMKQWSFDVMFND